MSDHPQQAVAGLRIAIVQARFNSTITGMLLSGCRDTLTEAGLGGDAVEVHEAPGAWELPLVCSKLAATGRFDALIALGAVVRGETAHFDFISSECAHGLQRVSLETGLPVAFGVLTPENGEQAAERADPKRKNKGREVALAALEMVAVLREIDHGG